MTKLSPAQLAILRKFGEGDKLCEMRGMTVHFFWFGEYDGPGINYKTVYKLHQLGLIGPIEDDWKSRVYAITPAGRAYLEGLE